MPDFGIGEAIALIGALTTVGTTIYETRAQGDAQQQAMNAQRQAQQQAQQQAMTQRRQQMMREGPALQSQVGGAFTPQQFQETTAALTGNPGMMAGGVGGGAGAGGGLTPAIENLFPGGGVPSLTEPWPTNV